MTRPLGGNYFTCEDCRQLTPHEADLITPTRRDEQPFVALTCLVCGHIAVPGTETG